MGSLNVCLARSAEQLATAQRDRQQVMVVVKGGIANWAFFIRHRSLEERALQCTMPPTPMTASGGASQL